MHIPRLVPVVAAAIFGCSSGASTSLKAGSEPEPADAGARSVGTSAVEIIELRYDETIHYQDVTLRWLELADSRCPIGVTCIWAGQLLATVEVVHGVQGNINVELLRRVGREPEISHAFGYELRLLGVDPHPKNGITPDRGDYVLSMDITKP